MFVVVFLFITASRVVGGWTPYEGVIVATETVEHRPVSNFAVLLIDELDRLIPRAPLVGYYAGDGAYYRAETERMTAIVGYSILAQSCSDDRRYCLAYYDPSHADDSYGFALFDLITGDILPVFQTPITSTTAALWSADESTVIFAANTGSAQRARILALQL